MKKRILTMIAAAAMTMAMSVTSFAAIGQWRQDSVGWWWERNGGSYLTNQWMWIDGNADGIAECYCFGPDGYMLASTTTPDGYTVNADGAWTVNGVVQSRGVLPEIDDEFAAEVSEFDTLEEYKADIKAKIKEEKASEGKRKQEDQVVEQAVKNASYEIPDAMIDTQAGQMADNFAQRLQSQGLTLEQYFQFTGMTAEKMMEEFKPQAVKQIETRLVLEAIVKAENIEISEEKLDEELQKMADTYKMEVEKIKEFMGENEKKQMKEDMAVQEAITFLVDNAVEK